jgi:para-nitrobenzyl esterase
MNIKNKSSIIFLFVIALLIGFTNNGMAQNVVHSKNPFQNEIDAFQKADQIHLPEKNSILLAGSSSFRLWADVNSYFPNYPILNRGFGGSTLLDLIHFSKETIFQYQPKQIFIYCGENDFAASDTVTPDMVFDRFKTLFTLIRKNVGSAIPIEYVSMKPSVARWNLESKFVTANKLIQNYLAQQKNAHFVDVHSAMLDEQGQVFKDIFIGDNLHMNPKGYAIWQKIFTPYLVKNTSVVVNTQLGKIAGTLQNDIQVFKGIPFAKPPVGEGRWKAPMPLAPWDSVKICNQFGPSPMQDEPFPFMCWSEEYLIPKAPINEDCLYLNVWSKKTTLKAVTKKPVLVYIYGGGFRSGGAACAIYDGTEMAKKDIVFVSINYRVGVFGFLAHPELSKESPSHTSGNYGLLDMIAALKWIKQNIASFGGDPDQVTIAGQSAGAFAVNYLCASPLAKGLFKGAIAESGGSIMPGAIRPNIKLAEAEAMGVRFADNLKAKSISDLRYVSADQIQNEKSGLSAPFEDGYVIPNSMYDIYDKGKQNDVHLLLGWNADDAIMGAPQPASTFKSEIEKRYGANAETMLSFYPANNDEQAAISQKNLNRDETFGIQGFAWANMQSISGKSKVFVYNFDRKLPYYSKDSDFGAFHTGEVVYAYNNLYTVNRPWETADKLLANSMSNYWVNFVKTGDPNGIKASGANLPNWPNFVQGNEKIIVFDKEIKSTDLKTKKQLTFLSSLL